MKERRETAEILTKWKDEDRKEIKRLLQEETEKSKRKLVVLDDDPTGVQTVHDVSVYTDWSEENIRRGFCEEGRLFYLLTNSRSFSREKTRKVHEEIAERVEKVAKALGREYVILSRSDSTLRGHYPLETETLREVYQKNRQKDVDGEILCPYFREGGRFTLGNVHYVRYGEDLIPASQTEFARDVTFGYCHSNLCDYVEEKTEGKFAAKDCLCIPLEMIRAKDLPGIETILLQAKDFQKIIVNAIDDGDVEMVSIALHRAMGKGKTFLFRCAAALVKALGNISDQTLLTREQLGRKVGGGVIVVGSHTAKTTAQLTRLKEIPGILFLEMNSDRVLYEGGLESEVQRLLSLEEEALAAGQTVCVSTKRQLLSLPGDTKEEALRRSVTIGDALKDCVGRLQHTPAFVVAKGGITSSDVGVKALRVRHATVVGQIEPGIPVWRTGEESRFPGIPYVIFPGNVGDEDTLLRAVKKLL